MESSLKPITVYGDIGANPPKVIMILEELGLPYDIVHLEISDIKQPKYIAVNPNGRLPAIHDPNTSLTLWESGAIVEYLVETYDADNKISFPRGSNESYLTKQWLYFQTTGQGPYYGQAVWFAKYHHEKLPSAIERYKNEINRVTGVLEGHLANQTATSGAEGSWLVGNRVTFADISWYMWQAMVPAYVAEDVLDYEKYPNVKAWLDKLGSRPSIKRAMELVA